MCGIAGVVRADREQIVDPAALRRMARALRHRGPDGYGLAAGGGVGLVSTRLAIVDVAHGWQPLQLRPGGSVLVYNGEVYNHPELRAGLAQSGRPCVTDCDTEVVLRLLEREGLSALDRLNGQFALAWWQPDRRRLTLARDRFGVRPLHFWTDPAGSLAFASEASALFASGELRPGLDVQGLDDVFTTWGPRPPRSAFRDVQRLGPGCALVWERGRVVEDRVWWEPDLAPVAGAVAEDLDDLLRDSVRIRLRSDVPVGTYLSGGLDSSLVTALACQASQQRLRTFSIAFDDARYDESTHQREVAAALGTEHHVVQVGPADIADAFREVVQHCEAPLVRTAPVPMALLAAAAREHGITVVASGEGADELFWGYDVFREVQLRRAALADPAGSAGLDGLYPHLGDRARGPAWRRFFTGAGPGDDPLFSHQTRVAATSAVRGFYSEGLLEELGGHEDSMTRLRASLPAGFTALGPLEKTQYLEQRTLLEPYLLAAQGDRVSMMHGVEGRFPFLDHRVFACAAALPASSKLDGAHHKVALRKVAARVLPGGVAARPKQPYRAPEVQPFCGPGAPAWVEDLLSAETLISYGLFDEQRVAALLRRCRSGRANGPREGMALVGVLSAQVWFQHFCASGWRVFPEETAVPRVRLDLDRVEERVMA